MILRWSKIKVKSSRCDWSHCLIGFPAAQVGAAGGAWEGKRSEWRRICR